MPWTTFDNWAGSDTRLISIGRNLRRYLLPLLDEMLEEDAFIPVGDCPVSEIQDAIKQLEDDLYTGRVGSIIATLGDIPANALSCDGQYYAKTAYPLLYAALPNNMKDLEGFYTPFLALRTLVGGANIGETGGESSHTLSIAEMPAHTHAVHVHIPGEGVGEVPTPIPDVGLPAESGVAGLGQPHNNMMPYMIVSFYIIAE